MASNARIWLVLNPKTGKRTERGPQRTRPREHAGAVVVDSWRPNDPPPRNRDAQTWDSYRARRGYAGGR